MTTPLRSVIRPLAPALAGLTIAAAMTVPSAPRAEAAPADVTLAQLNTMFGPRVSKNPRVAANLGELNRQMRASHIDTPQRQAAFLATLVNESRMDPAAGEVGNHARYRGRGYIQLTGAWNYQAAGKGLGVNLHGNPGAASAPKNSARIATWYWTKARPQSNAAADNFDMGRISRYVGYAADSREDVERCNDFKRAYKVLSGKQAPSWTTCHRR
ncbi:glycoside hydrolase family 19 protein [Luteococcus sp. OSA5]|uniref:glycoside hydrolase family 19 protein n=1 Tax=Luteococcus sp. OSA5 TaxID=3401630 RepID=UPI003B42A45F